MLKNAGFQLPRYLQILVFCTVIIHMPVHAVNITVDGGAKKGYIPHFWSECVGTGTMIYCLKPEWRVAAKIGAEEAGFKRVRGHGILIGWNGTDNDGIMTLNGGTASYNWKNLDSIVDFLLSINMQPSIELSFMPKALQSNTVISKPNDWNAWRDLIKEMVLHCIDRWGEEEVLSWYWEVWNEWDYSGFWNGTEQEYYQLYQKAAEGAKAANPNIIIGGPATTGANQLQPFVNYCKSNNVEYHFLANHCYGSSPGTATDPASVRNDNRTRSDVIKQSGKKLYSLNTEYSSTYTGQGGNTDPNVVSMDNHQNAPFVVKCMKLIIDDYLSGSYTLPDVLSYWAISDVFDESGMNKTSFIAANNNIPFGGVFGLITYQGLRKATFNAFKMLHMMGDTLLSVTGGSNADDGVDGFATVNSDGSEVAVVIYNFYTALSGNAGTNSVNLTVNNLPFSNGKVAVTRYLIDADHSNPYGIWQNQGKPVRPSDSQWDEMREAQNLAVVDEPTEIDFDGSAYTTSFDLKGHAVTLLTFKKDVPIKAVMRSGFDTTIPSLVCKGTVVDLKDIQTAGPVTLSLYSANGRLIRRYESIASSIDLANECSSGVHIIRLNAPQLHFTQKVTIW